MAYPPSNAYSTATEIAPTVKFFANRDTGTLSTTVDIHYAHHTSTIVSAEVEKAIRLAVIDELSKSPEFSEAIRKLAVERILKLLEGKDA